MTDNDFLSQTGYKHICTCEKKNQGRTYCPDDSCRPEPQAQPMQMPLPDREELIEELTIDLEDFVHMQRSTVEKALAYIQATPLTICNEKGRVLCTCSQQHADLSKHPDIAQAMQDDDTQSRLIPMPSSAQMKFAGDLLDRADYEKRIEVQKYFPDMTPGRIDQLIKMLRKL